MAALVSVVIPAYNAEKYLAEAVQSVLNQAYDPLEVIIVLDDSSQDGTARLAHSFGPPVRCLSRGHEGAGAARNLGLLSARGDLLAFLDADDFWSPTKLALQTAALASDPALDLVFGMVQNFLEPEGPAGVRTPQEVLPGFIPGAMLIRRAALERIGLFATQWQVGEVVDFYIRARELCLRELLLPQVVLHRRIHGQNLGIQSRDRQSDYLHILKASLDRKRGRPAS